jgi:hypothetical protein
MLTSASYLNLWKLARSLHVKSRINIRRGAAPTMIPTRIAAKNV